MDNVRTLKAEIPLADHRTEMGVLGNLLASDGHPLDCRDEVVEALREAGPSAFHDRRHHLIYKALVQCLVDNRPTDPASIVGELRRSGDLFEGLDEYVYALPQYGGAMTGTIYDAKLILDLYLKRELHQALKTSSQEITSGVGTYEEAAGKALTRVSDLADRAIRPETLVMESDALEDALGHIFGWVEETPGLPTGFVELDELTGGMRPGQVIVIAGRPGMGKSTIALQIARHLTRVVGVPGIVFSLEMPRREVIQRNVSADLGIPFWKIRDNKLDSEEKRRVAEYIDNPPGVPLLIDDDPDQDMGEIGLKTRKSIKDHGVGFAVLDYLQIVRPSQPGTRTEQISQISTDIRKLARKLEIPVITLSQLNREAARRDDQEPKITDLRESGQIEQDAHQVILTHLEYKVNPETERGREADLILAKNRNGITAKRVALFDADHSRFINPQDMVPTQR